MRAESRRCIAHQFGLVNRRGIDTDLVGTRIEHGANVLQGADATAHCQRNEYLTRNLLDGVDCGIALFVAGRDIEKRDLVGALFVIATRDFHRVTGVANAHKVDALHHPPLIDVEAGDDAFGEGHQAPSR